MHTLDLKQAAEFLKIHPVTLQCKAKAGEIPGAKPGKSWVFIDEDLANYIRSQYTKHGKRIPPDIGSQLITALTHQAKIVEIDDVLKRLDALENRK